MFFIFYLFMTYKAYSFIYIFVFITTCFYSQRSHPHLNLAKALVYRLEMFLLRDRLFNLKGGGVMVFCFVQNFFFGEHELEYLYFSVAQSAKFLFQNLTLGYMPKTLNQIIFLSSTKIRIFFSATLGIRIFF